MHNTERIESLDLLRGLAALSVCLFHFLEADEISLSNPITAFFSQHGKLGVQVFFVISGFIIPYSMHRAGYTLRNLPTFVAKREIRLAPPYLATIVFALALWYASALVPGFAGEPPQITAVQLASHFAYMSELLGHKWVVDVFWTLGIEFQYYVAMAVLFPLVATDNSAMRRGLLLLLLLLALIDAPRGIITSHLPYFIMGIATFHAMRGYTMKAEHVIWLVLGALVASYTDGVLAAAFGLSTTLIITYTRFRTPKPFAWLGAVSYSLYLVHLPIGNRVVNLGERFLPGFEGRVFLVLLAIAASLIAAYVMYHFIEKPSQRTASSLSYRKPVLEREKARHHAYAS